MLTRRFLISAAKSYAQVPSGESLLSSAVIRGGAANQSRLCDPVGRFKNRGFGQIIRQRRHQLDLTQEQVARRIKTSASFVAALEKGRRRPSHETIVRLANLLGLDVRQLFFLVNPRVHAMFGPAPNEQVLSAWEQFRNNDQLRRAHKVTKREMVMLSAVASLGEVPSPHEFIYVLNAVRQSLRC